MVSNPDGSESDRVAPNAEVGATVLPNASLGALAEDKIPIGRDQVVDWIEADLWRRFEKRLWAIVSGFLVFVAIAGLFGIPYYIKNETKHVFEKQTVEYENTQRQYLSTLKAYFKVESNFIIYKEGFRMDVAAAIADIERFNNEHFPKENMSMFNDPVQTLSKVLLQQQFTNILSQEFVKTGLQYVDSTRYDKFMLSHRESINLENRVLDAIGGTSSPHPFRKGDLEGFYKDVRIRLVVLAAYEQALSGMQQQLFRLGGKDELSKKTHELESQSQISTVFVPLFDKALLKSAKSFALPLQNPENNTDVDRPRRLISYYLSEAGIDPVDLTSIETISKSFEVPSAIIKPTTSDKAKDTTSQ